MCFPTVSPYRALHRAVTEGRRALVYAIAKRMAALNSLDFKDSEGKVPTTDSTFYPNNFVVCFVTQHFVMIYNCTTNVFNLVYRVMVALIGLYGCLTFDPSLPSLPFTWRPRITST